MKFVIACNIHFKHECPGIQNKKVLPTKVSKIYLSN